MSKQAYKIEFLKKWKIHNVFHVSLLKQNTTRKRWVDKNNVTKLDTGDNKSREYEVKAIWDSALFYAKESEGYLLGLYHLVS